MGAGVPAFELLLPVIGVIETPSAIRQHAQEEFDEWRRIALGAFRDTQLVHDKTKFAQVGWLHVRRRAENLCEQKVRAINQWWLAAKVQVQRLPCTTCGLNRRGHFTEDINVRAAKSIN